MKQCELHPSTFGAEFHGVIDQIGNGLEKQIAVAVHSRTFGGFHPKGDTLVLGDRLVEISRLANKGGEVDIAKSFAPAAMLDFRNAQQRRDRGQRLVETGDRLVGNCAHFLQRCGVLAAALEAYAHAGEWRAQVMGDVVAYHLRLLQGFLQQRRAHRGSDLRGYAPVTEETSFRIKQGLAAHGNIDFGAVPAGGFVPEVAKCLMRIEGRHVQAPLFRLLLEVASEIPSQHAYPAVGQDADSVKSRNRCSLARSASSARFWSSMSVSVPYHLTMFPNSSRSGWARLRNQRYSPSARRTRSMFS